MCHWVAWRDSTPWGTNTTESSLTSSAHPTPTHTNTSRMLLLQLPQNSTQVCCTDTQAGREHQLHSQPASSSTQPRVSVPAPRRPDKRGNTSSPTPTPTPTHTVTSKMPPPQLPQPSRQDHRDSEGTLPRREHSSSSQPASSSAHPTVSNPNPVAPDLLECAHWQHSSPEDPQVRTTRRTYPNLGPPRESNGLLTSMVNALSAAAAATDKFEICHCRRSLRPLSATADTSSLRLPRLLATKRPLRPPPEIRRRGGERPPRKAPRTPSSTSRTCAGDRVAAHCEGWMATAPSRT